MLEVTLEMRVMAGAEIGSQRGGEIGSVSVREAG